MSSWLAIIFTTLGGGAVGSIVTTYGTQTRERRAARAKARDSLRRVQRAARPQPGLLPPVANAGHSALLAALDDLDTNAMLAGLPSGLVTLYREATVRYWVKVVTAGTFSEMIADDQTLVAGRVMHQSAALLATATWQPWRSAPYRAWRTRRLRQVMQAGMPGRTALDLQSKHNLRKWEREVLRSPKPAPSEEPDYETIRQALREDG